MLTCVETVAINWHSEPAVWLTAFGTIALASFAGFALKQLSEIRTDRHIRVFAEFGVRWGSAEMTEALQLSREYTPDELQALFDPRAEYNLVDAKKRVTLMRIPNFFEEAAIIARVGKLEPELVRENMEGLAVGEWERWEPTIRLFQKQDPSFYAEWAKSAGATV